MEKTDAGAKLKIIFSMTVFGTLAIFVKNISLSSGEIALFRALIASVSIFIYKLFSGNKISFKEIKNELPMLFVSGVAMAFNWIFLFRAYNYTSVSIATLSYYFAPVILMVMSPILFKEKLNLKQIFCFLMATVGIVMVIHVGGSQQSKSNFIGIAYGLGAASLYATVIILNKYIKSVSGIDRTLIQFIAAIIILIPYLLLTTGIHINKLGSWGLLNLMILGIVHTGITYCFYFSSLKDLKGQEAALFSYIDPLIAIIVSITILNETMAMSQVIGGVMILGFTLLNEINIKSLKIGKSFNSLRDR